MKDYEKQYEDVFSGERSLKKCQIDQVTAGEMSADAYQVLVRDTIQRFQKTEFEQWLRIEWLIRKFEYKGVRRKRSTPNGHEIDAAFAIFMRRYVGFDARLFTRNHLFRTVMTYVDDFFPEFDELDPFDAKLSYPYEYMKFECLVFVYRMKERMELLAHGEEQQMSLTEFYDYVINYAYSYNDEHGPTYVVLLGRDHLLRIGLQKDYDRRNKKT